MARWDAKKHPRDKYGRFAGTGARGGTILKAVRGRKSKIISKSPQTTRQHSAGLRIGGGQNARIARGVSDWVGDVGRARQRRLAVGSGMRRRGQTVRQIAPDYRYVVQYTGKVRRGRPRRRS
jgi:hypothetical protein